MVSPCLGDTGVEELWFVASIIIVEGSRGAKTGWRDLVSRDELSGSGEVRSGLMSIILRSQDRRNALCCCSFY